VTFLEEKKGWMIVKEAGREGALRASATDGEEFYSEIGREGGKIGGLFSKERNMKESKNPHYLFNFSFIFILILMFSGRKILLINLNDQGRLEKWEILK
jgi:hypothetical protein